MIELYGHPFSSFTWKALIAAHAREVPFVFRMTGPDHPENMARLAGLSPTGQFPALVDGDREITGSNAVIAWLDRVGDAPPLIPHDPDSALQARMLADIFDDYVHAPMQRIVAECFRDETEKDPNGVAKARETLDRSYGWIAPRIVGRWGIGDIFTIADCAAAPALFYADWVHPIPAGPLAKYRARLLAHPTVARVIDEARPYRHFFPLGAPDRD
jgi:glutathione S-transferase